MTLIVGKINLSDFLVSFSFNLKSLFAISEGNLFRHHLPITTIKYPFLILKKSFSFGNDRTGESVS